MQHNNKHCMRPVVSVETMGAYVDNMEVPYFFSSSSSTNEKTYEMIKELGFNSFKIENGSVPEIDTGKLITTYLTGYSKFTEDELKGDKLYLSLIFNKLSETITKIDYLYKLNPNSLQYNPMNNMFRNFYLFDNSSSVLTDEDKNYIMSLEFPDHYAIMDFIKEEVNSTIENSKTMSEHLNIIRSFSTDLDPKYKESSRELTITPPYKVYDKLKLEMYVTIRFGNKPNKDEELYCKIKIGHVAFNG